MTLHALSSSPSKASAELVLGSTEPRLFTPPLRDDLFTNPEASYGHGVVFFASEIMGTPLDPWEEEAVIRAGEYKADGITPRFRKVLIIVARQNGKTYLVRVLTLFWLFVEQWPMVFGMSTTSSMAKVQWEIVCRTAQKHAAFKDEVEAVIKSKGEECLRTTEECEYRFGAANENGGRSLSIDRLIIDELRKHKEMKAWNAAYLAMNGRPLGQAVCITNQGDLTAMALRSLRADALKDIEDGNTDGDVCLLEWSAPDGSSPLDLRALAAANPNMNRIGWDGQLRMDGATLAAQGKQAALAGGPELALHLTEVLCMEQSALDAAVDAVAWRAGNRESWPQKRTRPVAFLDINPPGTHATLCHAAVLVDGSVVVAVREVWEGADAVKRLRADLPGLLADMRPQKLGWLPVGPGAALGAYMAKLKVPGCTIEPVQGSDVAQMCMGFAERVLAGDVVHLNDPLLEAHITGAAKYKVGETWRFTRADGAEDVDAAYAAAGCVQLALTLPKLLRGGIHIVKDE